ncbi:hypothetical protein [Fibrobacter sp.]|uniref:hypothetical protein n=1 Tax=Fibrobacter sp. TaxID=35828 RepID=UPI00388D3D99
MNRFNELYELQKDCMVLEKRASDLGLDTISADLSDVYDRLGEIIYQMVLGGDIVEGKAFGIK